MGVTVGVDIGGTKIAVAVVDENGAIVAQDRRKTPATDPTLIGDAVAESVNMLKRDHPVEAVGVGAAGFVDAARRTVLFAPNIRWVDEPLADRLEALVDLPVVVENDANAAAWGEFRFGAGADVDDMLLVTVGTGIGGGIIQGGRLDRGAFGVAGEIGHLRMVPAGIRCGCGQYGCWEQYASGRALVRETRDRITAQIDLAKPLADLVGGDVSLITGQMVTEQAQKGDPMAIDLIADVGRWLGEGIASLAAVIDPSVVAIGGGVAKAGDLLLEPARAAFRRSLSAPVYRPQAVLRPASLGNDAGMIGAADLARAR